MWAPAAHELGTGSEEKEKAIRASAFISLLRGPGVTICLFLLFHTCEPKSTLPPAGALGKPFTLQKQVSNSAFDALNDILTTHHAPFSQIFSLEAFTGRCACGD